MNTLAKWIVCGMVIATMALPTWAAGADDTTKAQNKLLALRAARADAMRKLAERIKGLHITSQTTVKDFVAESDTIRTAVDAFLVGIREKEGSAKFLADGSAQVTLEVSLETVVTTLKQIRNAYYKGDRYKVQDFEQMTQTNEVKVITETGDGAPRPADWESGEMVSPSATPVSGDLPEGMSKKAWAYWKPIGAQARLMATRAARADAMRKLAERIKGVYITSNTQVRDFVTESDEIKTVTETFLKGVRETGVKYSEIEPVVEMKMAVTMQTVYETVKSYYEAKYKGDRAKIKEFEERTQRVENSVIEETGMGVAKVKDADPVAAGAVENAAKWPAEIRAKGNAAIDKDNPNAAQAKLMAFRGAELDARRKLAEELNGLVIKGKTTVKDFVTASDEIRTKMMAFQQNARVIEESKKVLEDGSVEVEVEIDPTPLWDMMAFYQKSVKMED